MITICYQLTITLSIIKLNLSDSERRLNDATLAGKLEEFCAVLCENYGGWRWSILSRFWRILGVLVFGMSRCLSLSIGNGFGINSLMELGWINETKRSTVRFCCQSDHFVKFWKLVSKIMISNPKPQPKSNF